MRLPAWSHGLVLTLIGFFVVCAPVLAASDSGTLTKVTETICAIETPPSFGMLSGFNSDTSVFRITFGSYSPSGLTGGTSVVSIWDSTHSGLTACGSGSSSLLAVSGFSVDPGQDWLSSITCGGVENTGSGASSFSYSAGTAIWTWSQTFSLGSSTSCTIVHG